MRRILVNWLIDVHLNFKLLPETLFIAINLLDRFTQQQQIERKNYQLVGITCLLIAAKYEEIYPPLIGHFRHITDDAYSIQQIKETELQILTKLDFDVFVPSSLSFLERFGKLAGLNQKCFSLSFYFLELSMIEHSMSSYKPSHLASSAIFISKKITQQPNPWSPLMVEQTGYSENDLTKCAKDITAILTIAH